MPDSRPHDTGQASRNAVADGSFPPRMSNPFFDQPILNSPYDEPGTALGAGRTASRRSRSSGAPRGAKFITPIPSRRSARARTATARGARARRRQGPLDRAAAVRPDPIINEVRGHVDSLARPAQSRASGRSRRRRPGCSSTGGITSSAASARSSARSRRSRPRSG